MPIFLKVPAVFLREHGYHNDHGPTLAAYEFEPDKVWEHIELINNQPLFYNLDDCFITHAGISSFYKKILA